MSNACSILPGRVRLKELLLFKARSSQTISSIQIWFFSTHFFIMSDKIVVYMSSASGSQEIKKRQVRIKHILDGKKIDYIEMDLSSDPDLREKMRELMDDEKALPPQIFKGDQYCGNYKAFEEAIEDETLDEFLKLK